MKLYDNVTKDDLQKMNKPTYNNCEHYYIQAHNTEQTVTIEVEKGKFLTININPNIKNIDVKFHGKHNSLALEDMENEKEKLHVFNEY